MTEKLRDRFAKLARLAKNPNPNEGRRAAEKAVAMLMEHGGDLLAPNTTHAHVHYPHEREVEEELREERNRENRQKRADAERTRRANARILAREIAKTQAAWGRLGGSSKSEAKKRAARLNGTKGGRPRVATGDSVKSRRSHSAAGIKRR